MVINKNVPNGIYIYLQCKLCHSNFLFIFIILFISHFVKIDNFSSYENEYIKKKNNVPVHNISARRFL